MQKNDWLINGCKVGQSVPIGMKLELDLWCCLLHLYTNFQIDISEQVKTKSPENAQKLSPKFRKQDFCKKGTYVQK